MPDTTANIIFNSLDSNQVGILKHSLDSLTHSLANLASKPDDISGWLSFWSAIVGGALVIIGQYVIEFFKTNQDNKKELNNIISEIVRQRGLLRNLYRELAMYKTHASYWWYCTETERNQVLTETNRQDHLKSQSASRNAEREIGEAIATFLGLTAKFELTIGKTFNFENELIEISNLKTRPAKEYKASQSYDSVRNHLVIHDEMELKEEYYKNLAVFDKIILYLKHQISKASANKSIGKIRADSQMLSI